MIRIAIMYPNKPGIEFDSNYYRAFHLELVREKYTPFGLKGIELDEAKALNGPHKAPYLAIGYLTFESTKEFMNAIEESGEEIMNDVENFTNAKPILQVSKFSTL
uniref:EthD family reductase n=1 Tax=Ningiella ruwaisensis TaxID=2364274 RepID=UPI001447A61A|nr:EthD family reductase [Ningiella ruwaisensis]